MPTISPTKVPTKSPGTLFDNFTGLDDTLNIRWLTAKDPVFFEALNRPLADLTVRQLVLAKATDNLQLRLGHQALFPYVVQPRVASGTTEVDVPLQLIWDMHASMPKKWENLRLSKIKRIAGENSTTNGYDGWLKLIFTANAIGSATEVAIFSADYDIGSTLTYQPTRLTVVTTTEESTAIDSGETETVAGFLTFKTLDTDLTTVQAFLDLLEPPADLTDSNSDGFYDSPAIYEIVDTIPGGSAVTNDYSTLAFSHGTGLLTDSSWNAIPELDSDVQTWLNSFNYPYDANANRQSTENITIPQAMFREFNITAPAGDSPTGDSSGLYYPVWVSRIERVDSSGSQLRFYFSTYNVTDSETGGTPSTEGIEFASLDLLSSYTAGDIIEIISIDNLLLKTGADSTQWEQGFGKGHVVLSSIWGGTTSEIQDFFDEFDSIAETPADISFSQTSTRISSFGISRTPKYTPTIGQSQALLGSTSRLNSPSQPGYDNRFVTEADQGLGNTIDLEAQSGISANSNIDRYGYTGALNHRIINLPIKTANLGSDPEFYNTNVLPRLKILLGRDPKFGDGWYNGTRFMWFNGDSWQG